MDNPPVYMLDTNIINRILDNDLNHSQFKHCFISAVQVDELKATSDTIRLKALLNTVEVIDPKLVTPHGFGYDLDVLGYDKAFWEDGTGLFQSMQSRLEELDRQSKKKGCIKNKTFDISIGYTSIKIGATLVSEDKNLRTVTTEFGGKAITLNDYLDMPQG